MHPDIIFNDILIYKKAVWQPTQRLTNYIAWQNNYLLWLLTTHLIIYWTLNQYDSRWSVTHSLPGISLQITPNEASPLQKIQHTERDPSEISCKKISCVKISPLLTCFVLQHNNPLLINTKHIVNDVLWAQKFGI